MKDRITIVGNVAASPERKHTASGDTVAKFRVASPQSHFDSRTGAWVEQEPNWYAVTAYRTLAENALESIHQGERVIVTGTFRLRRWEQGDKKGVSADIDADALGHDLRWGTALYRKVHGATGESRLPESESPDSEAPGEDGPGGVPAEADQWHTSPLGVEQQITVGI